MPETQFNKKSQKLLQAAEVMQNIMHQWKQPLYAIYTLSSGTLLKRELGLCKEEHYKETLESINQNIEHLLTTMNYFNDFIHQKNYVQPFSLKQSILNSINIIQPLLNNNQIEVFSDLEDATLLGIEVEFMQVILNILNNSIYALYEYNLNKRNLIFIRARAKDNLIILSIKDSAGGIPFDDTNIIFTKHFTSKSPTKGSGIGLCMVRKIIEKHMHGNIKVQNSKFTYEGEHYCGAEFTITFIK